MLKYLMKLRHRKAFTLVELVIVMGILAVLMGCVAAFAGPVQDMVKKTASSADSLTANKIIGDYIENRLAYASRIDIIQAVDATGSSTEISQSWTAFQNRLSLARTANPNSEDRAGVLIFHYEYNANDEMRSRYQLYDVEINTTGSYSMAIDSSESPATIREHYEVFDDAFYASSENIIVAPTSVTKNKVRNSHYITFDIIPFDCTEDYPGVFITDSLLKDYYAFNATTPMRPDEYFGPRSSGQLDIASQRSGAIESITFELQNISAENTLNLQSKTPGGAGGSDILVFYYVTRY